MARYWSDIGHLPTTLYRLYSHDGILVYVGISMNIEGRFSQHRRKPWWPEVAHAVYEEYPNRTEALAAERLAIHTEDPVFNVARPAMHTSGGAA